MTNESEPKADQADQERRCNPAGSIWNRWDPHIHMPGTVLEDRFNGVDPVKRYVDLINQAEPRIHALGITDYCVLDSYRRLKSLQEQGAFEHLDLLFPNIELRLAVNAAKGSPVNLHLLVDPRDDQHLEKIERFLRDIKFSYNDEEYGCVNDELVRLGRAHKPEVDDKAHALRIGVEQFKVEPSALKKALKSHKWARENVLIAVSAKSNDGTGQLQESGLKALREELQRTAHIIFSASPKDHCYWIGRGADSKEKIIGTYGSLRPCLHGSDAHEFEKVGKPDQDRYCWLSGDVTFETLKQACLEPEHRVAIGSEPPHRVNSASITAVEIATGDWLQTPTLPINTGLVTVIGERGSGKTALVELIAAGANSVDSAHTKRSFLKRAGVHLTASTSTLTWGDGERSTSSVHIDDLEHESDAPRARYLSQQFVDQLCSSDGLAEGLVREIESVIFNSHPADARYDARNFAELRDTLTEAVDRKKARYQAELEEIAESISVQDDLKRSCARLEQNLNNEEAALERLKGDRNKLTPQDNTVVTERLEAVRTAAETLSQTIAAHDKRLLKLRGLKEEAEQFGGGEAALELERLKTEYAEAGLSDDQWNTFKLKFEGDVQALLDEEIKTVSQSRARQKGPTEDEVPESEERDKAPPYFNNDAALDTLPLSLLQKEQRRLEALIGIDRDKRQQYANLTSRIASAEAALTKRRTEVANAKEAPKRIEALIERRSKAYKGVVEQIDAEATILEELYAPLQTRLADQKGTLGKLTFSIVRNVDVASWGHAGEALIDRGNKGEFRHVGRLTEVIEQEVGEVWRTGTGVNIAEAMEAFKTKHKENFWAHIPEHARKTRDAKKQWFGQISNWLNSTDHVEVTYGIQYEGVDIQQLSPGTRGIVLLLLYLSIDTQDNRPLIIDQPEENLDPKSIYNELVERFKEAKARRQIIIVTHNANLVVNTDADQVVIASRGAHKSDALPHIAYMSGGLENPSIREAVCNILEGGETAFLDRARRLRIPLSN